MYFEFVLISWINYYFDFFSQFIFWWKFLKVYQHSLTMSVFNKKIQNAQPLGNLAKKSLHFLRVLRGKLFLGFLLNILQQKNNGECHFLILVVLVLNGLYLMYDSSSQLPYYKILSLTSREHRFWSYHNSPVQPFGSLKKVEEVSSKKNVLKGRGIWKIYSNT